MILTRIVAVRRNIEGSKCLLCVDYQNEENVVIKRTKDGAMGGVCSKKECIKRKAEFSSVKRQ